MLSSDEFDERLEVSKGKLRVQRLFYLFMGGGALVFLGGGVLYLRMSAPLGADYTMVCWMLGGIAAAVMVLLVLHWFFVSYASASVLARSELSTLAPKGAPGSLPAWTLLRADVPSRLVYLESLGLSEAVYECVLVLAGEADLTVDEAVEAARALV